MRFLGTQVAVLLVLALPAAASANDFQKVYNEYKHTGTIQPCHFSDRQLSNAQKQTPPDVEQYAPSFLDALQSARQRGADCHPKKAAPAPVPTPTQTTAAPTPSTPTPVTPSATTPAASVATPPPAPPTPTQPQVAGVPSPPIAGRLAAQENSTPAAVWVLAILGALVLLSAVFAGLAWWFGWSAGPTLRPWRASWDEFGGRLSDFGVEFRDWLRTGL